MTDLTRTSSQRITEILVDAGVVTDGQIETALEYQRESGLRIGEALVETCAATEEDIGWALARQFGVPFVDLVADSVDATLVRKFPEALLRRVQAVPLLKSENTLSVVFTDPTDPQLLNEIESISHCSVEPSLATASAIDAVLDAVFGVDSPERATRGESALVLDRSGARFLEFQVEQALASRATEIHFVSEGELLQVQHRIGSRLVLAATLRFHMLYALLARLESLGGPVTDGGQDHGFGRAGCPMGDREVVLDVSLLNYEGGLAVMLGLRQPTAAPPTLEALQLDPVGLARLRDVLARPAGLILVSGPPRSGCSTTLAALLAAVDMKGRRSIAFEHPTSTPMPAGIRLAYRPSRSREVWEDISVGQNADVLALDEVLTGHNIASVLSSAMSGRLVLATTDWDDSFDLLEHLISNPQARGVLSRRLHLVIQRRLVRPSGCTQDAANSPGPQQNGQGAALWNNTPIWELLFINQAMRDALREGERAHAIRALAQADGFLSLEDEAQRLVESGRIDAVDSDRILT